MPKNKFYFFCLMLLSGIFISEMVHAQEDKLHESLRITDAKQVWVDSVYNSLNEKERIGQLFMVAAYSGGEGYNRDLIVQLLKKHQIGGLIFMQGTPEKQAALTNEYQEMAQVPLLIGMDGEWGLGMRLTGVRNYPRQMLLGAANDSLLVAEMAAEIAAQCKRLGVHIDFAPDIDINNNPQNPIINFRSFGQDKYRVSKLGIAYMKGLQENGIIACAKHFPGHGDVSVDSHKDLPVISKSSEEINELELYPFEQLIGAGIKSIMVAHLEVPALDNTAHLPTTLSHKVVTGLLKEKMGFDGLIFTDALNMKGVTKYFPDGETDLLAFLAGNDVLLFSQDVPLAIQKIEKAIEEGKVSRKDLEQRVKKILKAKFDMGLNNFQPIDVSNVTEDLNKSTDRFWNKAASRSVTLVKDEGKVLQTINEPNKKIAYLPIHATSATTTFGKLLKEKYPEAKQITEQSSVENFDVVVVGIHQLSLYPGKGNRYGISASQIALIQKLSKQKNICFVVFGNAYFMKYLCAAGTTIVSYEDNAFTESAAIKVLTGAEQAQGSLPVTICH